MVKVSKYLILMQLMLLNLIGHNIIQCAATIQTEKIANELDLELIKASALKNREKVEELIKAGANVDAKDSHNGYTALMWAAHNGHKEIAELLIKAGADVNAVSKYGWTALMNVSDKGYKEIVELLIERGANVNAVNKKGTTALILAASKENKEIVELLINSGANVNAVDCEEDTALMYAAEHRDKAIIELLLRVGANINHKNNGESIIDIAQKRGYKEIVQMIEGEPSRRAEVIKKWIKENLARIITDLTTGQLIFDISNIIAEYVTTEYTDIPLEYRLNN